MERSVRKLLLTGLCVAGFGISTPGCGSGVSSPTEMPIETAPSPQVTSTRSSAPAEAVDVSWDTDRDAKFAKFLRDNSGGMIKKAAVGLEKRGELKVEISRAVEPEDTLTLTKSLMAGARSDFPDRPITLSLYDPQDAPILKANYKPGEGVHYQLAPSKPQAAQGAASPPSSPTVSDVLTRGGVTERDRAFAAWAETHGKAMLRYVEADLEKHGRLWFGVTKDVLPAEVRPLTASLLEGARKEFPNGDLVATVFDPNGERIGRAHLKGDGSVGWEQ